MKKFVYGWIAFWSAALALGACGNSESTPSKGGDAGATLYTVGGTVNGLQGTGLILQNNGAGALAITANGQFTFATGLPSGGGYLVTVQTAPVNPAQTCTVTGGKGAIASANVTSIVVTCSTTTYTLGGSVSGLAGTGLVLEDNTSNSVTVLPSATTFTFPQALANGSPYQVTVATQPANPTQNCTVTAGANGNISGANVTNVTVVCNTSEFPVGGTVSGLLMLDGGSSPSGGADASVLDGGPPSQLLPLILKNSDTGDSLPVTATGNFTFPTEVLSGQPYNVIVSQQPSAQFCEVTGGVGDVGSAAVMTISVACTTLTSCYQLSQLNSAATTGYAFIFPATSDAGAGPSAPIPVWCQIGSNPYAGDTTVNTVGGWTLVFNENQLLPGAYLPLASWPLLNPSEPNVGQYSILSYIAQIKSGTNYELYLTWPQGPPTSYPTGSVWWQQVENPTSNPTPTVSNLVENPPNQVATSSFIGLTGGITTGSNNCGNNAYLCGQIHGGNYWWSLGLPAAYQAGIPAFTGYTPDGGTTQQTSPNGGEVNQVQLWLR